MTTLIIVENEAEMGRKAATIIKELVREKPDCVLGLATGSTPLSTYQYMIEDYKQSKTNYQQVKSFNLDEYVGLDKSSLNSYHYYMNQHLFRHINIKLENTFIPKGEGDLLENCIAYKELLDRHTVDLQLLGIGANGHIGFNEPGVDFESTVHVVSLDDQTIEDNKRFFDSVEEVPTQAITMGIQDIMSAKAVLLLVNSSNKLGALQAVLKGPVTKNCPATFLRRHKDVTIIALRHLFKDVTITQI